MCLLPAASRVVCLTCLILVNVIPMYATILASEEGPGSSSTALHAGIASMIPVQRGPRHTLSVSTLRAACMPPYTHCSEDHS